MKPPDVAAFSAAGSLAEPGTEPAETETAQGEPRLPFPLIFQSEWPKLKTYLRRFVSPDDAEELAQEAFTRLYTAPEVHSPKGFLYRTARNLMIDRRRRQSVSGVIDVEDSVRSNVADPQRSPEEQVLLRERLASAQRMLDKMPARCREIFLLQIVEGMSYAEIAKHQGVSLVVVKKQLLKAFEICAAHAAREGQKRQSRARRERNNT